MGLYLIFRKLKKKQNTYVLYLVNEKRVVLKKLGNLSYISKDINLFVLHINIFVFLYLLKNSCFLSEKFFLFLYNVIN